jgi:hypothetical protein
MISPRLLVAVAMLALAVAGGGARAEQGKTTLAPARGSSEPKPPGLQMPGFGEPLPALGSEAAPGGNDLCRHMSDEERRKHPLMCGATENDGKGAATMRAPGKAP